jgi:hypothetical protein
MKLIPLLLLLLLPVNAILTLLVPEPAYAAGAVAYSLEQHSNRQTFLYVFTGTAIVKGKPTPNARVQLRMRAPDQPDQIKETVASADGSYELRVEVSGRPQEPADWSLRFQVPETGPSEIEGRTILMDPENTVSVLRPSQLVRS